MAFTVSSVEQISADIVRVAYSDFPQASDDTIVSDALNPNNYVFVGPGNQTSLVIMPVASQSLEIDLFLSTTILPNTNWTLIVSNVKDIFGNTLTASSTSFIGGVFNTQEILGGAQDITAQQYLRKYLNPALKGPTWNALLAAIGSSEQVNWDNARIAFDQMYLSTATGEYLLERGSDYGLTPPYNVAFSEDDYRAYVTLLVNEQLTLPALNDVLALFYGVDGTHASIISNASQPYNIPNGALLTLVFDGRNQVTINFLSSYFANSAQVSALEVATAINEQLQVLGVVGTAVPYADASSDTIKVKIISSIAGTGSRMQVLGGQAQNILLFDEVLNVFTGSSPLPTWTIVNNINNTQTYTSTTSPTSMNLSIVEIGDYVNIYGSEFAVANHGTFTVTDVEYTFIPSFSQSFTITNTGTAQTITQGAVINLAFYRPEDKTIYSVAPELAAYATQTSNHEIDITLPATPVSVARGLYTGAYLHDATPLTPSMSLLPVREAFANQITVPLNASVATATVYTSLENFIPVLDQPPVVTGQYATAPFISDSSPASIFSNAGITPTAMFLAKSVRLSSGKVLFCAGQDVSTTALSAASVFEPLTESIAVSGKTYTYQYLSSTMPNPVKECGISAIYDGSDGIISGGRNASDTVLTSSYYYNSTGNTWATLSSTNTPRYNHAQVTLPNGNVLIAGGITSASTPITSCEIYTLSTGLWTTTGAMNVARAAFSLIPLDDGKILAVGGTFDTTCELYDPDTGSWSYTGNRRYKEGSTKSQIIKIRQNRAIAIGGDLTSPANGETFSGHTEIYDGDLGIWYEGPALITDAPFEYIDIIAASLDNDGSVNTALPTFSQTDYQSIVVLPRLSLTGVYPTQFLEIKPVDSYLFNISRLKWKAGPSVTTSLMQEGSFVWATSDLMIYAYGTGPDESAPTTASISYVRNSDRWGYFGMQHEQKGSLASSTATFTANDILDYTQFQLNPTVIPFTAPDTNGIPGPYVWDPFEGITITGNEFYLTSDYYKGNTYSILNVTSTAGLPSSGLLVLNFGFSNDFDNGTQPNLTAESIYPVSYIAVVSSTQLKLSSGFTFPNNALTGSSVSLLAQQGPFNPPNGVVLGSLYLTDTPAARIAAQNAIDLIAPAGPEINENVVYPSDNGRGLGGEGYPTVLSSNPNDTKLSDVVDIFAGSQQTTDSN